MGLGIGKAIKKAGKKLSRAARKVTREVKRAAPDLITGGITAGVREVGKVMTPDVPDIAIDATTPEAGPQYVMPDEEEIMRARRRRGRASQSGRSSTILSDSGADRLGG